MGKYEALAAFYNRYFPGYQFNPRWLAELHSQELNVGDPYQVAQLIGATEEKRRKIYEQTRGKFERPYGIDPATGEESRASVRLSPDSAWMQNPERVKNADSEQMNLLERFIEGFKRGHEWGADEVPRLYWNKETNMWQDTKPTHQTSKDSLGNIFSRYSRSAILDRAPEAFREGYGIPGQIGFEVGAIAADLPGYGTRKILWNTHPADITYTQSSGYLERQGIPTWASRIGAFASTEALGLASGNYSLLNLAEGGRPTGFEAISPDSEDPRKSTNPVADLVIHRGFLGRTGKLLPWEQFSQERPDVSYEEYEAYKNYLYGKDPGPIEKATFGLVKTNREGIDGPEARVLGYRVTPEGAALAVGTTLAFPIAYRTLNKYLK